MTAVLVTYANADFADYQAICSTTGALFGFDEYRSYGPDDIDPDFRRDNAAILGASRGAGYWLWKPYFVARTLAELAPGDVLFYTDAAVHFLARIDPMIEHMDRHQLDLLVLGEGFTEAKYTKRDAFVLMDADRSPYTDSPQRFASSFLLRKCSWAESFVDQFLEYAQDERILTDHPNQCGRPNYPQFVAHRHDQSIFSVLTKKEGVSCQPSTFVAEGLADRRGQILNHTRAHHSPRQVVTHLLSLGILTIDDLRRLGGNPESTTE